MFGINTINVTMENKPKIIALYLPQYHPFKENDEWWGKGFTEWTSVGRAKPLFKGHYQPRVPADLGYYDLRLPIVREQQAQLAREAGVYGFCYWHYWFGNGKRLMETVFDEVLESGKPDFPFCLGWANHSWYAKNWNTNDTKGKDRLLIEQTFPGDEDIRMHYELVLKAFNDPRYIKEGNKPVFMIYKADDIPENFISLWNKWSKEDGFDGVYFIANIEPGSDIDVYTHDKGLNAVIIRRTTQFWKRFSFRKRFTKKIKQMLFDTPNRKIDYKNAIKYLVVPKTDIREDVIPSLIPNFDHSPRSGKFGLIYHNSTPELFKEHATQVLELVKQKKENKFVMLRSWNEWGEGNYMEPDTIFGKGYIKALSDAIKNCF